MKKKSLSWIKETVETVVIALVLAFLIRSFIVETFWIPSGSMEPTLMVGDRIMAYKIFYGINKVKRGDIIIFKFPLDPKKDFVKRVIGLPGDTIEIRKKEVYVNKKRLIEPYAVHSDNWDTGFPRDEYGPVKVPPDSLFVLGDNRDSSEDSRYWGYVPKENIIGKAFLIYWPPWRIRILKTPLIKMVESEASLIFL
ncbi:signal peptidase I [Candidatus Aerophobetes bacterium]|uniref:Signal peptidase I n=1 Tax=Aerophobetes bacterium TaxID=2030807 RepID=A0A662D8C5_UNCAE|nr:signal peptidase I [Candidatus Aerophobetes bacterium]RLE11695.1 MAG: signal peptidase I [Candidatus Aerophobetes bacterium]